jgi:hypothetical protein
MAARAGARLLSKMIFRLLDWVSPRQTTDKVSIAALFDRGVKGRSLEFGFLINRATKRLPVPA